MDDHSTPPALEMSPPAATREPQASESSSESATVALVMSSPTEPQPSESSSSESTRISSDHHPRGGRFLDPPLLVIGSSSSSPSPEEFLMSRLRSAEEDLMSRLRSVEEVLAIHSSQKNLRGGKKRKAEEVVPVGGKCSVCLKKWKQGRVVPKMECGHLFHKKCIRSWLSRNPTCPLCRLQLMR